VIPGYDSDGMQWFDMNSQENLDAMIVARVALTNVTENYDPDYEMMSEIAKELGEQLREMVAPLSDVLGLEENDDFIRTRKQYNTTQKEQIIKEGREWDNGSWLEALMSREARYCAFMKDEPYPENNRPRAILASSNITKYYMGKIFNEIGEAFFSLEQTIKKTTITDRPRVLEERLGGEGYVYGTDHSAFEAAATKDIQEHCEQIVYSTVYPELKEYFEVFAQDIIFSVGRRTSHSEPSTYFMPCSRWSGAPNTSLGNSITNYVFIKMLERATNNSFKFCIEGDDGLIVAEKPLDEDFCHKYAEKNGFSLKMDKQESINTAGFLSMSWDDECNIEYENIWKYLVSAITFRPWKVRDLDTYYEYMKSKFMSLCVMMPKHELFIEILKGIEKLQQRKGISIFVSNKTWTLKKYDELGINYDHNANGSITLRDIISTIEKKMKPEYYGEIYMRYCITDKLVKQLKRELNSGDEKLFNHAVREIIEIYHTRISCYDDLTEY